MKTLHFITVAIILTLLLLGGTAVTASAKDGSGYTEISGVVKDRQTKKKLGYVKLTARPRHHAQNELAMEAFKKGALPPRWQRSGRTSRKAHP